MSRPDECTRPCTEQTRSAAHQRWRPKGLYQQQSCRSQDGRQGGPIDRIFPSGGPAGRTCYEGFSAKPSSARGRVRGVRGPETGSLMPHDWTRSECGGPLNRGIAPNAHAAVTLNFPHALSRSHHNHKHDNDTHTYQNKWIAE